MEAAPSWSRSCPYEDPILLAAKVPEVKPFSLTEKGESEIRRLPTELYADLCQPSFDEVKFAHGANGLPQGYLVEHGDAVNWQYRLCRLYAGSLDAVSANGSIGKNTLGDATWVINTVLKAHRSSRKNGRRWYHDSILLPKSRDTALNKGKLKEWEGLDSTFEKAVKSRFLSLTYRQRPTMHTAREDYSPFDMIEAFALRNPQHPHLKAPVNTQILKPFDYDYMQIAPLCAAFCDPVLGYLADALEEEEEEAAEDSQYRQQPETHNNLATQCLWKNIVAAAKKKGVDQLLQCQLVVGKHGHPENNNKGTTQDTVTASNTTSNTTNTTATIPGGGGGRKGKRGDRNGGDEGVECKHPAHQEQRDSSELKGLPVVSTSYLLEQEQSFDQALSLEMAHTSHTQQPFHKPKTKPKHRDTPVDTQENINKMLLDEINGHITQLQGNVNSPNEDKPLKGEEGDPQQQESQRPPPRVALWKTLFPDVAREVDEYKKTHPSTESECSVSSDDVSSCESGDIAGDVNDDNDEGDDDNEERERVVEEEVDTEEDQNEDKIKLSTAQLRRRAEQDCVQTTQSPWLQFDDEDIAAVDEIVHDCRMVHCYYERGLQRLSHYAKLSTTELAAHYDDQLEKYEQNRLRRGLRKSRILNDHQSLFILHDKRQATEGAHYSSDESESG